MKRLLITFVIILNVSALYAQLSETSVSFYTENLEFMFYPPLRKGLNSPHSINKEVPLINYTLNLLDSYLRYLKEQNKIEQGLRPILLYSPDLSTNMHEENQRLIRIHSIKPEDVLVQLNTYLSRQRNTDEKYLISQINKITTIASQSEENIQSEIPKKLNLQLVGGDIDQLVPDSEFCIIDKKRIALIRPTFHSNKIYLITETNNGYFSSLLLSEGKGYYSNLAASPSGKYIALTSDLSPFFVETDTGQCLFPFKPEEVMIGLKWAPNMDIAAGMVLNKITQERNCFVYDVKNKKHIFPSEIIKLLPENSLYTYPYWSPDSQRIIFASSRELHLIDLKNKFIKPNIVHLKDNFSELIWSEDSKTVAIAEFIGQTRNHSEFDDLDFRGSVLHRYRIDDNGVANEDYAQNTQSRFTLIPIGFSANDRLMYLEGRLFANRMDSFCWDLSNTFKAMLTPMPSIDTSREDSKQAYDKPSELPIHYLYLYRTMNGKRKSIFDAGFNHSNQLVLNTQENFRFLGLRGTGEVQVSKETFSQRMYPYPFIESNSTIFCTADSKSLKNFIKFLEDYQLGRLRFSPDNEKVYFLANFHGPMKLWSANIIDFAEGISKLKSHKKQQK